MPRRKQPQSTIDQFKTYLITSINQPSWSWPEFTGFTILTIIVTAIFGHQLVTKFLL